MGAGASASVTEHAGKTPEEIAAIVAGLDEAGKAALAAALEGALSADASVTNRKNISENEANIHNLAIAVTQDKAHVYEERSRIEGNRTLILKNYSAAFVGNRQMANQNTDDIYKNRSAILDALTVSGSVQENFRNSKYNEASIEYINNRCLLNNRVAKANVMMSAANDKLIELNNATLKSNEEIVKFNSENIDTNKKLLEAGVLPEKATPEANEARIAANTEKIKAILDRNGKYNDGAAARYQSIEDRKEKIYKNAADIGERCASIKENRKAITANGEKVSERLRAAGAGDDVGAAVKALSEADRKNLAAALAVEVPAVEAVEANRKAIAANEAALHKLHLEVMTNKEKLYAVRSLIEENRLLILKNYAGAFVCNRQCANQNTDDIFKNRTAILDSLKVDGAVGQNFRNSKHNESNIAYLENRSLLNNRVAKVNALMSEVNEAFIEINNGIMKSNEEIVAFNSAGIDTNTKLLEAGILPEKCIPEANAARIKANGEKIAMIQGKAGKYDSSVDDQLKKALANRELINTNSNEIRDRRKRIKENRLLCLENGDKVAELIKNA